MPACGAAVDVEGVVEVPAAFRAQATLFGESASRVVVSASDDRVDGLLDAARTVGVPARVIGRTGGDRIAIAVDGQSAIDVAVADAESAWATAIEERMARR